MASASNDWQELVRAVAELGQAFGFEVAFALNPVMDVMCCKVAGITVEISRTDLENRRFLGLYDAMKLAMLAAPLPPDPCPLELEPPQPVALVAAVTVPDLIIDYGEVDEGKS